MAEPLDGGPAPPAVQREERSAPDLAQHLGEVIDGHRWDDLPALLHPEFSCRYVQHHFEVATFITVRDGLVAEMTEVWTDVEQRTPGGTRLG